MLKLGNLADESITYSDNFQLSSVSCTVPTEESATVFNPATTTSSDYCTIQFTDSNVGTGNFMDYTCFNEADCYESWGLAVPEDCVTDSFTDCTADENAFFTLYYTDPLNENGNEYLYLSYEEAKYLAGLGWDILAWFVFVGACGCTCIGFATISNVFSGNGACLD